jgi:hypothetical protein
MTIYKFNPTPNGQIDHVYKLFLSEAEAYTIPGIIIEDTELAEWMLVDAGRTYDTYYYDYTSTTITPRPTMAATANKLTITADGVDTCIISSLPNPCSVTVDDATYEVIDGSFEFSTLLAGEYVVKLESFPYKPKEFLVTAV